MELSAGSQKLLLRLARESIAAAVSRTKLPKAQTDEEELKCPSGVFVTLHDGTDLRGCIGYVEPVMPLIRATQEVAVKAALEDPRFDPVTSEELPRLSIEISVLSPLEPCTDVRAIEIGKHGLVIEAGFRRGLLLPQVATEYGWDREQFLSHTAQKAGLGPDAWKKSESRLFVFSVEKFSESDLSTHS